MYWIDIRNAFKNLKKQFRPAYKLAGSSYVRFRISPRSPWAYGLLMSPSSKSPSNSISPNTTKKTKASWRSPRQKGAKRRKQRPRNRICRVGGRSLIEQAPNKIPSKLIKVSWGAMSILGRDQRYTAQTLFGKYLTDCTDGYEIMRKKNRVDRNHWCSIIKR